MIFADTGRKTSSTTKNDKRATRFGSFCKWSLDELPQLFNVLKR